MDAIKRKEYVLKIAISIREMASAIEDDANMGVPDAFNDKELSMMLAATMSCFVSIIVKTAKNCELEKNSVLVAVIKGIAE